MTPANLILHQNLFSQEVVIKGGSDRLAVFLIITLIVQFYFIALYIDSMSRVDLPCLVHILHISIKDTELVQKLSFIEIFGHLFLVSKAGLNPWFRIKTRVCEKFSIVENLTEVVIVFYPLFILIMRFLFFVHKSCNVLDQILIARF